MSELAHVIDQMKARRSGIPNRESALLQRRMLQLLAQGQPVSAEKLAAAADMPVSEVEAAFSQMQTGGGEFSETGELVGAALTLNPTRHRFRVNEQDMYAWCALDTLFLPALLEQPAHVTSTCPVTGTEIQLRVTPQNIENVTPESAALSIVTASGCTSGPDGSFCGQVHFFASAAATREWIGNREGFAVLTVAEAFQLAEEVYIQPFLEFD